MDDASRVEPFGHKTAWIAVRDGDPAAVAEALHLADVRTEHDWRAALDAAYDAAVAVTPQLPGASGRWVLATGTALLLDPPDVAALSAALGAEVQLFATHRVVEAHRWARAVGGSLVRDFEYVGERGEVTRWHGVPDPAERDLGVPAERQSDDDDWLGETGVDEASVMAVARACSVDPTSLGGTSPPLLVGRRADGSPGTAEPAPRRRRGLFGRRRDG